MALLENEEVSNAIGSGEAMMEQLRKALGMLEPLRDSAWIHIIKLDNLEEYFHQLRRSLKKEIDELEAAKWKLEEKQAKTQATISEREAAIAAKEQALLDRLQELKDNAVSAIAQSCKKHQVASPNMAYNKRFREGKVSTSANADTKTPISVIEGNLPDNKSGESAEQMAAKGHLNSSLKQLCQQMDTKGVVKYISENRKNLATLREELPLALKCATEPARMVLDALEGFYPPDQSTSQGNENDTALQGLRRSCLILMESAVPVLASTEPGDHHPLSSEIKQQAKAIANQWKPKMADMNLDASNGGTLEAQAFLQLLATFCIPSEFDEDELCKIILTVSRRRQTPELCRSLGLTHKMPGMVETLVNTGRQIDAVHFAYAFQLTESFPPVPLLKAYLDEVMKNVQEISGNVNPGAQKDATTQELGALRAVIRCIEEYKLQEEYPIDPLQKRVIELEKAKAEKKRSFGVAKFQMKKPRGNAWYAPHKPAVAIEYKQPPPSSVYNERGMHHGGAERYMYAVPPAFEVPSRVTYSQQANIHSPYQYSHPHERVPSAPYAASSSYSGYIGPTAQNSPANQVHYVAPGSQATSSYSGIYLGAGYHQPSSSNYGNYSGAGYPPSHQS